MKYNLIIGALLGVAMSVSAASAASLSIVGGVSSPLGGDFKLGAETGLSSTTEVVKFSAFDTLSDDGLLLDMDSPLLFEFLGSSANAGNKVLEFTLGMSGIELFTNFTSSIGDTEIVQVSSGQVPLVFETDRDGGDSIRNGEGSTNPALDIAFYQIDSSSVIALFDDGGGPGPDDGDFDDLAIKISVIPLPAGILLMLTAMGALVGVGQLRQRR